MEVIRVSINYVAKKVADTDRGIVRLAVLLDSFNKSESERSAHIRDLLAPFSSSSGSTSTSTTTSRSATRRRLAAGCWVSTWATARRTRCQSRSERTRRARSTRWTLSALTSASVSISHGYLRYNLSIFPIIKHSVHLFSQKHHRINAFNGSLYSCPRANQITEIRNASRYLYFLNNHTYFRQDINIRNSEPQKFCHNNYSIITSAAVWPLLTIQEETTALCIILHIYDIYSYVRQWFFNLILKMYQCPSQIYMCFVCPV